ncbi:type I-E CRISPR-associated protein Cas7/Cse4/CasC [Streptomyces avermitilis]|uniref:Cse4 protein n=2 Tax=Streptomyces avermitilis TaxID=33903 RepID=Q825B8_STRAW|nr:type I-E CRISPR-associated protein Cas7/Cse4/CasC [Streptomyces avermitilis]MYT03074.1 type I-E CRISPR-associated protein Cas7/Cse4/CasC [Streptomyces sp. SID5469]KUN47254.1 type I-E CRISPR-associated protein Cas7/Cse4/CasC [Streptomyces avermitilis]BAC75251.1 cse4 [Streptomyces avermitilis MA-4680 = NBRC 14893]BAU77666.1 putative CRISPR-associated protein Cse4 [Streptomyces avermitilis MA-4680 = NBRC 14893]GDY70337.1 type I-E CRISPR-associated protein Cas7/Cse4/CasC [Streptomyces avermitil
MLTPARFIDIHVLQSVPFANLNRDDTNSVKTVQYGNTLRTRVSSQSWKRAIRSVFEDRIGQAALRTRRIGERVTRELEQRGWPAELAQRAGGHTAAASGIKFELAKSSGDAKQTVPNKVLTNAMVYVPEAAVAELADLAEQHREELQQAKDIKKPADKSILPVSTVEAVLRSRNGVINLFGRMLAEINDAGVDGAVQVAHALTTHETDVELDYFSAVDDVTAVWNDATGSGHMGHAEFSAGTFYRYATLDLRNLVANIGDDPQAARELTTVFLASFITSLPQAKKNSTAPHTIPDLVHLSVRTDRPLSYAAAFEKPVQASPQGGFADVSRTQLAAYAQAANTLLGTTGILTSGWASLETKDLTGLGERRDSFDDLITTALDTALTHTAEANA